MRQKADKLEKGKWYADLKQGVDTSFFRFEEIINGLEYFETEIGNFYDPDENGKYVFKPVYPWYLPTPEDIEKYNLNEE